MKKMRIIRDIRFIILSSCASISYQPTCPELGSPTEECGKKRLDYATCMKEKNDPKACSLSVNNKDNYNYVKMLQRQPLYDEKKEDKIN